MVATSLTKQTALGKSLFGLRWLAVPLAAVPPLLVIFDRWLGQGKLLDSTRGAWCRIDWLCGLRLPPYFALVFICILAVLAIVGVTTFSRTATALPFVSIELPVPATESVPPRQRMLGSTLVVAALIGAGLVWFQRVPANQPFSWDYALILLAFLLGWVLHEMPVSTIGAAVRRHGGISVLYVLAQAALVNVFGQFYSGRGPDALSLGTLALMAAALFHWRRRVHPLFWFMMLALVISLIKLDDWTFSVIGDEGSFYSYAREIVEKQSITFIGDHLFRGDAVYGSHPYFSSLIQAVVMKFSDLESFGWRFSSIYLGVLAFPFLYSFYRSFVVKEVALLATFLLAVSHYLVNFDKIGYNNSQALFAMGLALAITGWAVKNMRPLAFVLLGAAIGLCFYVYPAALYVPLLVFILLDLYRPLLSGRYLYQWGLVLLTVALFVLPLIPQGVYWSSKVGGTFANNPNLVGNKLVANLETNSLYAFFSFLYTLQESHFVDVSYVDPLTAVLIPLGLALWIGALRRSENARVFLFCFGAWLFVVGATHDREVPSTTRMFLVLPWFMLLAASGVYWVRSNLPVTISPRLGRGLLLVLCSAILAANLVQAYVISPARSTRYQNVEAQFVRLGQTVAARGESKVSFLLVNDPKSLYAPSLQQFLHLYYLPFELTELRALETTPTEAASDLLASNSLVIISPRLPADVRKTYEGFLTENADSHCEMRNLIGNYVFTVWYSKDTPPPCPP